MNKVRTEVVSARRFTHNLLKPHIFKYGLWWNYNSAKSPSVPGVANDLNNNVDAFNFCALRNNETFEKNERP